MKITVINDDNALGFDGIFYHELDFSNVPDDVHALQWNGAKGEIEFYVDEDGEKPANEKITELPSWVMGLKPQWDAAALLAKQKQEAYEAEVAKAAAVEAETIKAQAEADLAASENLVQPPQ